MKRVDIQSNGQRRKTIAMNCRFGPAVWLMIMGILVTARAAHAEPRGAPIQSTDTLVARCEALSSVDFTAVQDAPTQIMETKAVLASGKDPAYCRVQGYVAPQVGFELRLPLSGWNGMFLEVGDGGWGGAMFLFLCDGPLRKGYACIASDMGHKATPSQAMWALNNLQAQIDFGYRAAHVTALIGKAIVAAFYSKAAAKSMMLGCSTGGYQSMVEAQRFPWDFDGIVAVAPDIEDEADLAMRKLWQLRNFADEEGHPFLDRQALELLHTAALAKCDITDGVKDGIVGDPVGCRFDPWDLVCKRTQTTGCLTPRQAQAAKNIYEGATTSTGVRISTRGVFPGSELEWSTAGNAFVTELFKYAMFPPTTKTDWKLTDFDFDQDYKRLGLGVAYTDSNPDLRKFKAAGGKLIVAQGGNDTREIPGAIFDYYETVERTMGGRGPTQEFFRLFLVPAMNHCTAGDGPFAIDYLSYLESWVEQGRAPDKIIGAHVDSAYLLAQSESNDRASDPDRIWGAAFKLVFPLDPSVPVTFTRPVYPYPLISKYKGAGNPNDAANFRPANPLDDDAPPERHGNRSKNQDNNP
jgi:Tannase and feruloyl esterase